MRRRCLELFDICFLVKINLHLKAFFWLTNKGTMVKVWWLTSYTAVGPRRDKENLCL